MPRLINTYIFKEITVPFLLSLAVLTATGLLSKTVKLIELMVTHGIGPSFIFRFIVSVIPSFLIYTLPVSFLIGVLVAFTRLSSDSEITAMKSTGLGLFSIMKPVLLLAFIAYLTTLAFTLYLFPWGNVNLRRLLFEAAKTKLVSGIEEKTFYDKFKGVVLYVDHLNIKTGEMEGIFISQTGPGTESNAFFANKGVFSPPTEESTVYLKLYSGTMHRKTENNGAYHIADFESYVLELSISGASEAGTPGKPNRELYISELVHRIKETKAKGESTAPYMIDLHKRLALPASVFVFALLGVPLGIQKIRAARFTGFSVALAVVLMYYVVSTALEALGENGRLNPVLAVWGSDIIFVAVGVYIFYSAAKDRPIEAGSRIADALRRLLRRKRRVKK
ncbi:MAG: LPS export ABC transporter permease LptF [Deltaproteobacteria bacterium]|nr:LPS export ABC transporter permease LptF [Deltaproteobacteria bacterium]